MSEDSKNNEPIKKTVGKSPDVKDRADLFGYSRRTIGGAASPNTGHGRVDGLRDQIDPKDPITLPSPVVKRSK